MKHFILYGLAAVLIFTMLGRFAAVETVSAAEPSPVPMAVMAKTMVAVSDGEEEPPAEILTGLLQVDMSSMDDMYFKNAFEEELGEGFSIHTMSTSEGRDQMVMFRKMVEKGYRLIVVELYDPDMAEDYIDLAQENGIGKLANLIMLGALWKATGFASMEALEAAIQKVVPPSKPELVELNMRAIRIGTGEASRG